MIFLETKRLRLRNIEEKDLDIIYDYRNHELCSRYQRGQTKNREGLKKLISERKYGKISLEEGFILTIALKETDEMAGEVVVMPEENMISMGYTISYKHHRKGFAFEILSALIELLHEKYPHHGFICLVDPENIPSMELLKKLGYEDMGYEENTDSQIYGKWVSDTVLPTVL
ncbi:GNAT family N-acetyltransferase [Filifactor villosus]|uniref:GNAT family N-acetyltransferase n=1 Tax=Filifactor villosus TaxID=29374 RepID=A0ABV9QSE1_9FIRM